MDLFEFEEAVKNGDITDFEPIRTNIRKENNPCHNPNSCKNKI